jgi:hypothetical protein
MHRTIYFLVLFFVAAFAAPNPPSPDNGVPQQGHQVGDIVGVKPRQYETGTGVGHSLSLVPKLRMILISIAERS